MPRVTLWRILVVKEGGLGDRGRDSLPFGHNHSVTGEHVFSRIRMGAPTTCANGSDSLSTTDRQMDRRACSVGEVPLVLCFPAGSFVTNLALCNSYLGNVHTHTHTHTHTTSKLHQQTS